MASPESSLSERGSVSPDRPISSRRDDLLGRAPFAASIARSVDQWAGKDSLVLALYGPWGSGKSSIKNMLLEQLSEAHPGVVSSIEFNPWQWSGHDVLADAFFKQIAQVLGKERDSKIAKARARMWRNYANYLHAVSAPIRRLGVAVGLLKVAGAGAVVGLLLRDSAVGAVSGFFVLFFGILALLAIGSDALAGVYRSRLESGDQSLPELKASLAASLRTMERPLLVVLDDIDRLSPVEMLNVFQLVKANADFPNLVYLLLFQRDIVEAGIGNILPGSGSDFLEKIVQVAFDAPALKQEQIDIVLTSRLTAATAGIDTVTGFDERRWVNLYALGLRPYFRTLRDVYRFSNIFAFQLGLFTNRGVLEVNMVDLIGLEVLRLFEPSVYGQIVNFRDVLLGGAVGGAGGDENRLARLMTLFSGVPETRRARAVAVVGQLFTPARWLLDGHGSGVGFGEGWLRELRVCSPGVFDRYFSVVLAESDISQASVRELLALTGDRARLAAQLQEFKREGRLEPALGWLDVMVERIDLVNAGPFVTAILDVGDDVPEPRGGPYLTLDLERRALLVVERFLGRLESRERARILEVAIRDAAGIVLGVEEVWRVTRRESRQGRDNEYLLEEGQVPALQQVCLERIRNFALTGRLEAVNRLKVILWAWREWAGADGPREWVDGLLSTHSGLLRFLRAAESTSTSQTIGEAAVTTHRKIDLDFVATFASIDTVVARAAALPDDALEADGAELVRLLCVAAAGGEEGGGS